MQIDGTIVAPDNRKDWNPKFSRLWLDFYNLTGVLFHGIAVIEGSGSKWWAASCKKNKTNASLEQRISQLVQEKAAFSEEEARPFESPTFVALTVFFCCSILRQDGFWSCLLQPDASLVFGLGFCWLYSLVGGI